MTQDGLEARQQNGAQTQENARTAPPLTLETTLSRLVHAMVDEATKIMIESSPGENPWSIQNAAYTALQRVCEQSAETAKGFAELANEKRIEQAQANNPSRVVKEVDDFMRPGPDAPGE
jgi:hypothetical protein